MSFLKKYFLVYAVGVLLGFFFLRWRKERSFSTTVLDEMLYSQSKTKGQTDNPCLYALVGQPEIPGEYLKLTITCGDEEARFSFDYRAIREKTVKGVLAELFRINGVSLAPEKLTCRQGIRRLTMTDPVARQDTIECVL